MTLLIWSHMFLISKNTQHNQFCKDVFYVEQLIDPSSTVSIFHLSAAKFSTLRGDQTCKFNFIQSQINLMIWFNWLSTRSFLFIMQHTRYLIIWFFQTCLGGKLAKYLGPIDSPFLFKLNSVLGSGQLSAHRKWWIKM